MSGHVHGASCLYMSHNYMLKPVIATPHSKSTCHTNHARSNDPRSPRLAISITPLAYRYKIPLTNRYWPSTDHNGAGDERDKPKSSKSAACLHVACRPANSVPQNRAAAQAAADASRRSLAVRLVMAVPYCAAVPRHCLRTRINSRDRFSLPSINCISHSSHCTLHP